MTRFTFTSVVCAESITETSSSSGLRNGNAIFASACSTASRSMTGRIRSFFGADALARASCDVATRHGATLAQAAERRAVREVVASRAARRRQGVVHLEPAPSPPNELEPLAQVSAR